MALAMLATFFNQEIRRMALAMPHMIHLLLIN
jgi:hypothetical protein